MLFAKKFLLTMFFTFILAGPLQPCLAKAPVKFFVLIASYNNAKMGIWSSKNILCSTVSENSEGRFFAEWGIYESRS